MWDLKIVLTRIPQPFWLDRFCCVVHVEFIIATIDYISLSMSYEALFDSKGAWSTYMSPRAQAAEDELWQKARFVHEHCEFCGCNSGGMAKHISGQKHWRTMRRMLNFSLPPFEIADGMHQPWVERCDTTAGPSFFNHLTGRYSWSMGSAHPHPQIDLQLTAAQEVMRILAANP